MAEYYVMTAILFVVVWHQVAALESFISPSELHNIDILNRTIYLGATNSIYKLDGSLKIVASTVTGPELDNPYCIGNLRCDYKRNMTDNVNKILVVYEKGPFLIACGTIFQGYCQTLNLTSLGTLKKVTNRYVSANYPSASTVGFISKGPAELDGVQDVLFVGATNNKRLRLIEGKVASVASISLKSDSLFNFIEFDGVPLVFKIKPDSDFKVDYVFGFADDSYSFLATVQREGLNSQTYHSKLVRVCQKDESFKSYTEMPLSCSSTGINYNILISATTAKVSGKSAAILNVSDGDYVFIGLFGSSQGEGKKVKGKYGVCAYSFKSINIGFKKNIDHCLKSGPTVPRGIPWATNGQGFCTLVTPDYCGKNNEYPIGGSIALRATTSMIYEKEALASLNVIVHSRGLAVFLGTESGSLLKFSADKSEGLVQYGREVIESGKAIKKLTLYSTNSYILAMGKNKLAKVLVADCDKRSTCKECLYGPGCGWCTLENKCSIKAECRSADRALRFVSTSANMCPSIAQVNPPILSASTTKKVTVVTNHLPPLTGSEKYLCTFNGIKTSAVFSNKSVVCDVPKTLLTATFTSTVTIALQLSTTHLDLVATKVVMYNCNVQSTCISCTQGSYGCDWCGGSLRCVDRNSGLCGSAGNVINYTGPSTSDTSSQCPRITRTATEYIPHGIERQLEIIGENLPQPVGKYKYACLLSIEGKNFTSSVASHNTSRLICDKTKYTFSGEKKSVEGQVHVLYGNRQLYSAKSLQVTVYKCDFKREECSICLRAPKPWGCGWCMSKGQCGVAELCQSKWVNSSCPAPHISEFYPKSASVAGGTTVIIKGRDLGTAFSDIDKVTVADQTCTLNESLYILSKQVACTTTKVEKDTTGKVIVYVKTSSSQTIQQGASQNDFAFRTPKVQKFSPIVGPCSGGTKLNVSGLHLDIGRRVDVLVSAKPCKVIKRTSTKILCTTSKNTNCKQRRRRRAASSNTVVVTFDGHSVPSSNNQSFVYVKDPVVNRYFTNNKSPRTKTYVSGGQTFKVEGERFKLIQKPLMRFHVYETGALATGPCKTHSDTVLHCLAPNVSGLIPKGNQTIVGVGFIMDNVQALLRKGNITIVRDPVFLVFGGDDKTKVLKTRDLILEGVNLDILNKDDVKVTVGGLVCEVTSLDERLVCTVPEEDELTKVTVEDENPSVIVTVGDGSLKYTVGFIKFFKPVKEKIPFLLYIGPAAAGVFVLILIIIILVVLYRRRNKKEKEYHKVYQLQMDNLESRYARECKEAFAELQTEITDLTTDLSASVVPYLDFETYAMRILFPGIEMHPVMEKECNKSDAWKKGMLSLCHLIKEKEFLLCFVRTLEAQSSFSMRDRCKVASLLMVTLQDDIAYCTSVLRDLLSELIEKSVETGRTKLLLRRTESVAEKLLTNWLAYNLHGFVEERVGETLFRLFAAIGALLDKEPVDAVTHEARNSLSEDKLLRQKVDFKPLNVKVEYEHDESIHVQLLNIDTISQAKQKVLNVIYKNVPFSQRRNRDALELGWILPTGGVKVMNDEDDSNEIEGEWKRVNTLEHYKVTDGALFRLSPCGTNYSVVSGSPLFHETSMPSVLFHPNNSSTPMLNHHSSEQGSRLWHLVKASDFPMESRDDSRHSKMMAEVYLTRLLKTKGTLQNFVDDLFDAIFKVSCKGTTIPPAVKYLFDYLDKQALLMGIEESEVIHTWKNNSLPLRFWINIIKNPNFIFDVFKSSTVDSCLSVVGQLFMDSCSPDEHRLGKDSPSNKLLYAKDIPKYKQRVIRFYWDVRNMPSVNDNELSQTFVEISKKYGKTFNHLNAASELLGYAVKYKVKVMDALEVSDMEGYADRLQEMMETLPDD